MAKWPDRPHWTFHGRYLGSDEHGAWIGSPAGARFERPGASFVGPVDQLTLVPSPGGDHDRAWVAAFHGGGGAGLDLRRGPVDTYVDIATPPRWEGSVVRSVDLDLDVIRGVSGRVWVDDEDEFADHRVRFGYPAEIVAMALHSCDRVQAAMAARTPPYDGTAVGWFESLAQLPDRGTS